MMGFAVSTVAVFLTAWIVYAATRRAAYLEGIMDANRQWRRELDDAHSDDPRIRNIAARFNAGRVPAGTCATPCHPADCDDSCPRYPEVFSREVERQRLANVRRTIRDDPGHSMMCDCGECLRVFGG